MSEFKYKGKTLEEMQKMSIKEFAILVPARQRRTLLRGLTSEQVKLVKKVKAVGDKKTIKTHLRDMIVLPAFVGVTFGIHNGKEFKTVEIIPEMIGHYLGEYSLTRISLRHSAPGVGASRSSKFVPIK